MRGASPRIRPATIGRRGILRIIDRLVRLDSLSFVDDVRQPEEQGLAEERQSHLGWTAITSTAGHHGYTILPGFPLRPGLGNL